MQVRDAMASTISTVRPNDSVKHAAELMRQEDAGFMPVCDNDRIVGVITDRDIVTRCIANGHDVRNETVEHCMSRDIKSIDANADLDEAGQRMGSQQVRRLAVLENGRLVGVLSHGNLVQATHDEGPGKTATVGVTRGA